MGSSIMKLCDSHVAMALIAFLTATSAVGQQASTQQQCSEIAHRIACHSVAGACAKGESEATFEKRNQLEFMVSHLCSEGPKNFGEFYWVDVHGAFRPYYTDRDGRKTKFPPERSK